MATCVAKREGTGKDEPIAPSNHGTEGALRQHLLARLPRTAIHVQRV